jgi:hypothetical protein
VFLEAIGELGAGHLLRYPYVLKIQIWICGSKIDLLHGTYGQGIFPHEILAGI